MPHRFDPIEQFPQPAFISQVNPVTSTVETPVTTHPLLIVSPSLAAVQKELRLYKRRHWLLFALSLGGCALFPVFLLAATILGYTVGLRLMETFFILSVVVFCLSFIGDWCLTVNIDSDALQQAGDARVIGALIGALMAPAPHHHRRPLYAALTVLLRQMRGSDAFLLTEPQRSFLIFLLNHQGATLYTWGRAPTEFLVASLQALEQVGDAKAIPVVERLATMAARNERQRRLKEAALKCLPLLKSIVGRATSPQTLLRGSVPSLSSESLLRSALPVEHTVPEHLLRASGPEDKETT